LRVDDLLKLDHQVIGQWLAGLFVHLGSELLLHLG
jgi:hypothetical protein